jgi:putative ABC transport system permease protein
VTTALRERPAEASATGGGAPARRAVIRWALRLFRREWRQQLLVLALLAVAVATMILGAAVATNTPRSIDPAFGSAGYNVTLSGNDPHLASDIAAIKARFGTVDVIENQALSTGLASGVQLRAQDPNGRYGNELLSLVSGHYPTGPGEAAVTSQLETLFNLHAGGVWHQDGRTWQITGVVQNPANLLDTFALVAPGQVTAPTEVTVLFDASGVSGQSVQAFSLPGSVQPQAAPSAGGLSPAVIVLALAMFGLIFVGLVAVAGFTVLAQRRLRAIGVLSSLGAADRDIRLVMTANGAVVGVVATLIGAVAGFAAWFAYAPHLQSSTEHVVHAANLPWSVIGAGMALAAATAVLAARKPAKTVARIPVVSALSGRPPSPKGSHRSAVPGVVLLVVGPLLLAFAGGWGGNNAKDTLFLLAGIVATCIGCLLLAPVVIGVLAAAGRHTPIAVRLALRDLGRYRARSGAALAAVAFAVLMSVLITVISTARLSNVLDYAGPNLQSNQLIVYSPYGQYGMGAGPNTPAPSARTIAAIGASADGIASALHAQSVLTLESAVYSSGPGQGAAQPTASLYQEGTSNNNFSGPLYVATPALLREYGIKPGQISAGTDILTMRSGLAAEPRMQLIYGAPAGGPPGRSAAGPPGSSACPTAHCLANPTIQEVSALPSGTSAPNTVITTHAVHALGLREVTSGWLIQTAKPLTSAQINSARQAALAAGANIEAKSGELGLSQITTSATTAGILIALAVLAMTIGLIRSETASDLRTLTATGAGSRIRRTITGTTAGALALLGGLMGTAAAYIASIAWFRSSLATTVSHVPVAGLIAILVGMPLAAAVAGWLLAGREPATIARQPLE